MSEYFSIWYVSLLFLWQHAPQLAWTPQAGMGQYNILSQTLMKKIQDKLLVVNSIIGIFVNIHMSGLKMLSSSLKYSPNIDFLRESCILTDIP